MKTWQIILLSMIVSFFVVQMLHKFSPPSAMQLSLDCSRDILKEDEEKSKDISKFIDELDDFYGLSRDFRHPSYNAISAYYDHKVLECIQKRMFK